jgi:hypothetical protein
LTPTARRRIEDSERFGKSKRSQRLDPRPAPN